MFNGLRFHLKKHEKILNGENLNPVINSRCAEDIEVQRIQRYNWGT